MTVETFRLLVLGLVILGRAGDILSTRFVTPNLALEANPIARRMGWKWILITSLVFPVVPFLSIEAGVVIAVGSLLVTYSNLSAAWMIRAVGEDGYRRFVQDAARRSPEWIAHVTRLIGAACVTIVGVLLLFGSGGPDGIPYWVAIGILAYAGALGLHGTIATRRLYRGLPRDTRAETGAARSE